MALLHKCRVVLLHYPCATIGRVIDTSTCIKLTGTEAVIVIIKLLLLLCAARRFEALSGRTSWSNS
jgi:hypothetical protein